MKAQVYLFTIFILQRGLARHKSQDWEMRVLSGHETEHIPGGDWRGRRPRTRRARGSQRRRTRPYRGGEHVHVARASGGRRLGKKLPNAEHALALRSAPFPSGSAALWRLYSPPRPSVLKSSSEVTASVLRDLADARRWGGLRGAAV
jgi:hypothetical protein